MLKGFHAWHDVFLARRALSARGFGTSAGTNAFTTRTKGRSVQLPACLIHDTGKTFHPRIDLVKTYRREAEAKEWAHIRR